ncbi:NAD(P)/FAD-dependent oxidoreductase [bacterium]|nr:NAD(P)/FAD-dependent oxidoreductase [bacterium]
MYDCIIIGSGIIGSSIARELSKYKGNFLVLEKENDVSCGTTKANSGIVHAGFDAKVGTLKAKFNVKGAKMFEKLASELEFPYKKNGAFVLSFDDDKTPLEDLLNKGRSNGVDNLSIISGDEVRKIEPNVSKEVKYALYAKDSGIVSPYEMCIAISENASTNNVKFEFLKEIVDIKTNKDHLKVLCKDGTHYESKVVINASGVYSDELNNKISNIKYKIVPRKGEYCLLDKEYSYITSTTLFQLPTKMGKGILVAPTTHSNILVGPSALDIIDKSDTDTTYEGLNEVWAKALLTVPSLPKGGIITQFSGIRAHSIDDDFTIGFSSDVKGLYNLIGIESPGLASSPAIAEYAAKEIADYLKLSKNENFIAKRSAIKHVRNMNDKDLSLLIKENKDYGHIICRCEVVSEGEIKEAIRRNPGAKDLDGIKRRVRAGMGRCQMGFCTPKILEILSQELGLDLENITKKGNGSVLLEGRIKE